MTSHTDKVTSYFIQDNGAGFDMKYAGKLLESFNVSTPKMSFPEPASDWRRSNELSIGTEGTSGLKVGWVREQNVLLCSGDDPEES